MVKTTLETADYATPALANEKKAVWGALAMVCLLCVGTFLVASTVTEHQDRMTELVSVSGPVRIGDKIALKNAYNNVFDLLASVCVVVPASYVHIIHCQRYV
eukprot:JP438191.1.p1 GENE.JP438191.1~~JP438191.1.p1  ORF type:complete len:110 (-),score=16.87 JP438191.1:160-465(-)